MQSSGRTKSLQAIQSSFLLSSSLLSFNYTAVGCRFYSVFFSYLVRQKNFQFGHLLSDGDKDLLIVTVGIVVLLHQQQAVVGENNCRRIAQILRETMQKPGRDDLCPALFLPVYEFLSRIHLIQHRKRCPSGNGELRGVHDRDTAAQQHLQRPDHTGVDGSTAGCHHRESLLMGL